ncbi:MAG: hypothetical protein K940chlam2_01784, partial [Chlamydiae bacterium]|nr:hypothetical protein [Chlamydiota bacterium]
REKSAKRIAGGEHKEHWEEEFGGEMEMLSTQRRGLKDLESVRRDSDYELFFIKNDNGLPYFNTSLLRHIRLIGNFDDLLIGSIEGEDPFLSIKKLQDRSVYEGAKEILKLAQTYIDDFYGEGAEFKDKIFAKAINKALMALLMAGHTDNLMESGGSKGCLSYYTDFQSYLRAALGSPGYKNLIVNPPKESEYSAHAALSLLHALCCFFFFRVGSRREAMQTIHELIDRGEKLERPKKEGEPLVSSKRWQGLFHADENMRLLLKHYPNGPLLKTLDSLREKEKGYDPIAQQNFPKSLYSFKMGEKDVTCLHMPTPTRQEIINRTEIIPEFRGLLRYFQGGIRKRRHLLINMQDRTSWQQFTTSKALESFARGAEFADVVSVITFPRDTDFYWQHSGYQEASGAPVFFEHLDMQLQGGEQCGYYFPEEVKAKELFPFVNQAAKLIHEHFFNKKTTLIRRDRLDFLEIFQNLLVLKCIEITDCDSFSLSCKDGVDKGSAMGVTFFLLFHLMTKGSKWTEEEWDTVLWLYYSPALVVRDRMIDPLRFKRSVMVNEVLERGFTKKTAEALNGLYPKLALDDLSMRLMPYLL